jgi:alpha-1,2-mannosyltransferase
LEYSRHPTLFIAVLTLLPIVAIGLLGWHYAAVLQGVLPADVGLTNFDAIRYVTGSVFRSQGRADSWFPMLEAMGWLRDNDRSNLYETLFFAKSIRFQYPPTSLLPLDWLAMIKPLTVRELNGINFLVYCLNAAAAGAVAWLVFRPRPQCHSLGMAQSAAGPAPNAAGLAVLVTIAAFLFYPLMRALLLGQIQVWIDTLFTFAVIFWIRDRRMLAGVCIGLACAIKPQFILFLIWGLLWREVAFGAGIFSAFAPIAAISLLRYGLHNNLEYLNVLAFLGQHGESFFPNNSVNGILNSYFLESTNLRWDASTLTPYNPIVYAGTLASSAVTLGLIVFLPLLGRCRQPGIADFCAAAICTVAGSPIAWEHHYGILLPAYVVALRCTLDMPTGLRRNLTIAGVLLSWVLVANLIPFAHLLAQTPFRFVQAHCFFGALLLLYFLSTFHGRLNDQVMGKCPTNY